MAEKVTLEKAAFGASVAFLRAIHGWSQETLSEKCDPAANLDASQISRIEAGKRRPGEPKVRAVAKALGVPISVLQGLQEEILSYVHAHPADLDSLLRVSGLLKQVEEIRETPATYDETNRERYLQKQWQDLAREQAAAKEREVLLVYDTISLKLPPPSGTPPKESS